MVAKVHGLRDYASGNAGSCTELVDYLNKENEGKLVNEQEYFFNSQGKNFTNLNVIQAIDNNKKGLKNNDAKFFMLSINPSKKELKHLTTLATGREINDMAQMSKSEREKYNEIFKAYINDCMELYAQGFNKELTREDILYFAKIEQERSYKGTDKEVKEGKAKSGELKPGLQTHAHIVVSRKDRSMKHSISPLANSRGSSDKHQLNGKNVQVGFDREKFKIECETLFDVKFEYQRSSEEYYLNAKANKYIQTVSHQVYNSYIHKIQSMSNTKDDSANKEAHQLIMMANAVKNGNVSGIVKNMSNQMKINHASDFNKVPPGQFLHLAKSIASANPVQIARQVVKIITTGMEM